MKKLVIDIETAPICEFSELDSKKLDIWNKKFKNRFEDLPNETYKYDGNASFFTLFAKIICISVSFVDSDLVKSYIGEEKTILENLSKDLKKFEKIDNKIYFVGHNIKRFDIPFILQKAISYNIDIPYMKKSIGCKPWETSLIDTIELFQMSSNEYYSLDYICNFLNIPTPKNGIDGSQVWNEFKKGNIDKIAKYCEADVLATKQIYIKIFNYLNS